MHAPAHRHGLDSVPVGVGLAQETGVHSFGHRDRGLAGRGPGDPGEDRARRRVAQYGGRDHHGAAGRGQRVQAVGRVLPHRPRQRDPRRRLLTGPQQVRRGVLHQVRTPASVLRQLGQNPRGHRRVDRQCQLRHRGGIQAGQPDDPCSRENRARPLRDHNGQTSGLPGDEIAQQRPSPVVGPLQVLDDEHQRRQRVEQIADRAEQAVPFGRGVGQWRQCGGQVRGDLRQVGSQRAGDRARRQRRRPGQAQRLEHRAEGEHLARGRLARAAQHGARPHLPVRQDLPHQPGLPDPGRAGHAHDRRRREHRADPGGMLLLPPHKGKPRTVPFVDRCHATERRHQIREYRSGAKIGYAYSFHHGWLGAGRGGG